MPESWFELLAPSASDLAKRPVKFVGVDALFVDAPNPLPFCDLYRFEDDMIGI